MSDLTTPHQHRLPQADRGRTQDRSRDDVIISAALELLGKKGYHGLTMTEVATCAGVSKATLYRRWTAKADLVADAVATLSPLDAPQYMGASLRDDLLTLMEQAGNCETSSDIVTATMEMARLHPDLYQTLTERFGGFIRTELGKIAGRFVNTGHLPLTDIELDLMSETAVAFLSHQVDPKGASVPRERLILLVDHVLMVLMTGTRAAR